MVAMLAVCLDFMFFLFKKHEIKSDLCAIHEITEI